MKRLIALMLVLLLALNTIPSVAEEARTGVDLTYARIVEMTRYMRQLATGDYLDIKMVPEAQQTIARTWAEGIADMPRLVVQLDIEKWSALRENQLTFSQEPDVVQLEAESTLIVQMWQYLAYYTSEEAALTEASYEEMMRKAGRATRFTSCCMTMLRRSSSLSAGRMAQSPSRECSCPAQGCRNAATTAKSPCG